MVNSPPISDDSSLPLRALLHPCRDMSLDFWQAIEPYFTVEDGWWTVPWQRVYEIAHGQNLPLNQVERQLLHSGVCPSRYLRNLRVLGLAGQHALLASTVFIAGCGGLGGRIAEMLVRAGVGTLVLVDDDLFSDNNLNRQVACTESTIGDYKCLALKAYLETLNSATCIIPHCVRITHETIDGMASGASMLVDGLDDLSSRLVLLRAARRLGVPLIHGSVENWCGQTAIISPESSEGDVLEHAISEILVDGESRTFSFASPCCSVSMVASLQVAAIFHVLCGKPSFFHAGVLQFDMEYMDFIVESLS